MHSSENTAAQSHSARIQAELAMRQSIDKTNQDNITARPQNTKNAYDPKIKEFEEWCDIKFAHEPAQLRYIVTGEKAHYFLDDAVVNRTSRRKRKRNDSAEELPLPKIGYSTLCLYGAAIMHLYRSQQMMKINANPNPRSTFAALLQRVKREEEQTKKLNYEDRGVGSIMDGYTTTDQLASVVGYYFQQDTIKDLRNSLSFLLSHFCLLRGESARQAQLPDLQVLDLEGEGSQKCPALILVMRQGKTNKFGRMEIGACIRNARVEICPFMMLGVYFFGRFHVENEPFPRFENSSDWFDIQLLKHKADPKEQWTYHSHCAAIDKAFKACNITSSKKTHVSRGAAARMADMQGVEESDIRRMGRWNNSSMNGAYLTNLPRGIMRSLAGFTERGTFFLPRATITPSENLQAMVFPEASHWLSKLHDGTARQTVSAEGFLQLMMTLRITFLQDSVFMQQLYPAHSLWKNPLFRHPEYLEFKRELLLKAHEEEHPENILLQRVIPVVERRLTNIEESVQQSNQQVVHLVNRLLLNMSDISTGRAPLQINISWPEGSETPQTTVRNMPSSQPRTEEDMATIESSLDQQTPSASPSSFSLSVTLHSLEELYREWTEGLGGLPSVETMNVSQKGWYTRNGQKTLYMRRNRIMKTIKDYAASNGITVADAVRIAENRRQVTKKSLSHLGKNCNDIFE